jgi:hypothetical protein
MVLDAEHDAGVHGLGREDGQRAPQLLPVPGVNGVPRVPGAGVHPDLGRTDGLCGLEAPAELVDPLLPARRVDAVDGGRVRGERHDRDTFGVRDRGGCADRGSDRLMAAG